MSTATDKELLLAWRAHDEAAGATLVARHVESIFRFFRSKLSAGAEELTQTTFSICLEKLDRLRDAASFRAFLFGIARRVLLRHLRNRARSRTPVSFDDSLAAEADTSIPSRLSRNREIKLLAMALRGLPLTQQLVIELHYWEGMTTAEVAEVLEIPRGTVKWKLAEARSALKAEIERLGHRAPGLAQSTVTELERWARELRSALVPPRPPDGPSDAP